VAKISLYDGSMEIQNETVAYDASAVKNPEPAENPKMNRSCNSLTTRAWLFGHKIRFQCGKLPKNHAMLNRPF
jgi:hypothetical protein